PYERGDVVRAGCGLEGGEGRNRRERQGRQAAGREHRRGERVVAVGVVDGVRIGVVDVATEVGVGEVREQVVDLVVEIVRTDAVADKLGAGRHDPAVGRPEGEAQ